MKKRLIALAITLCVALVMVVPAGAVAIGKQTVSDEQYQEYVKIVEEVSQEYGVEVFACPIEEMTIQYSAEEYEAEIREFCAEMEELQNAAAISSSGDSTTNPSAPGSGTKILNVNTTRPVGNGYFGWTLRGRAVIASTNGISPYRYSGSVSIDEVNCYLRPSAEYTATLVGGSSQTSANGSIRVASQTVQIKKNGTAEATFTLSARFNLNTSTGVVTMTAA